MSHTINMLAKRNIQKYKKHYLIVLIVLLARAGFRWALRSAPSILCHPRSYPHYSMQQANKQ